MKFQGNLIVIDGADGAGKATQTKLLVERLRAEGREVETMSFPGYEHNTFGKLIRECLDGKRGDFSTLDPCIASVLYAGDRFESKPALTAWLEEGKVVVLDRYVSANMLHQGSKIHNDDEALREFLAWLDHLEHEVFGLPRPDLIVYLDVPYAFRRSMMRSDGARGALDTVELNQTYQENAEACAKKVVASTANWQLVSCVENDELLSPEAIHGRIYDRVTRHLASG